MAPAIVKGASIGFIGLGVMGAALCNSGRGALDNAALGLLFEELSGIKR